LTPSDATDGDQLLVGKQADLHPGIQNQFSRNAIKALLVQSCAPLPRSRGRLPPVNCVEKARVLHKWSKIGKKRGVLKDDHHNPQRLNDPRIEHRLQINAYAIVPSVACSTRKDDF